MKIIKLTRKALVPVFVAMGLLSLNQLAYAGDPAAGQQKSAACAACHGADGNSQIKENPRLAGQYEDYLVHALNSYRNGDRQNPIMGGLASTLSDEDIADLAAWFASQQGVGILNKDPM